MAGARPFNPEFNQRAARHRNGTCGPCGERILFFKEILERIA
jgi:5-methylcytosine-specific restriction endonuclease McrA